MVGENGPGTQIYRTGAEQCNQWFAPTTSHGNILLHTEVELWMKPLATDCPSNQSFAFCYSCQAKPSQQQHQHQQNTMKLPLT